MANPANRSARCQLEELGVPAMPSGRQSSAPSREAEGLLTAGTELGLVEQAGLPVGSPPKLADARGVWARARHFLSGRAWIAIGVLAASAISETAEARKFDFKNESLATFFKGTYGPSQVMTAPYGESSGTSTESFSKKIQTNYSGEFGVLFASKMLNLRLSAELLLPRHTSDVKGSDASGNELFNLETKTSAVIPWASVEFLAFQNSISKVFLGAGVGYAYVKMENIYSFTAAGTSTYSGMSDFVEKAEAEAITTQIFGGYEVLFADNSTFVIDAGYRYLPVLEMSHLNAVKTFQGDVVRGDRVTKDDGGARELDLGGAYVGIAFRFYIGL